MGTKTTRLLVLFTVITVAGVAYVVLRYAGAAPLVGLGPTEVRLELADAAGLTMKNEVTYRGLPVGEVGSVHQTADGVEATLRLDRRAPPIPASATAVLALRSAIGEAYVDLQPPDAEPPFLTAGSVIPQQRTRLPLPTDAFLASLNSLAASVPVPELRTTVDELHTAFTRTGPDLQRLTDSGSTLVGAAQQNLSQTTALLRDGRTVLGTQSQLGPQIASLSRDLQTFTDQLRRDDPDLRRLLTAAPSAAAQLEGLLREIGPDLSRMVTNLLVVTGILEPRLAGLEQFLVTGPAAVRFGNTVLPGDGYLHFGLVLNVNDPPPCRSGYLQPGAGWRTADALDPAALDTGVRCGEAPPINVRGAQNAPTPDGRPARPDQGTATTEPPSSTTALNPVGPGNVLRPAGGGPSIILPGLSS